MTKEQFISGVSFRVKNNSNYVGAPTFRFENGCIIKESRSSLPGEGLLFSDYHFNTGKISKLGFEGFVFILDNKKINIKHKFEDLVVFVAGE